LHNQVQTAVELQQNGYWHTIEDVSTVWPEMEKGHCEKDS
jgi:hypothetical protein